MLWNRKRLCFEITDGQVDVEDIDVVARRPSLVVIEVLTACKYPEVVTYSGGVLLLAASGKAFPESYDPKAASTEVRVPSCIAGWEVMSEEAIGYQLRVAFFRKTPRDRCAVIRKPLSWGMITWLLIGFCAGMIFMAYLLRGGR